MKRIHRILAGLTFVASIFLITSAVAAETPADNKQYSDWSQRCNDLPNIGKICYIVQQLRLKETQDAVLRVAVGFPKGSATPIALFTAPLGIGLREGLEISVDEGEQAVVTFENCNPEGCHVRLPLDSTWLLRFTRGNSLRAIYRSSAGQRMALPISLRGFTHGYKTLQALQ